jgi:thiamine-monophosphate kinase
MGADPYAFTLSLSLPKKITHEWISKFVKKILYFQNKYNFFLLGGDISQSNQLIISSNFFGYVAKQNILKREFPNKGDDIWVTGYLGDSAIGLALSKKQIVLNDVQTKYFTNKFLFPRPCMIGSLICKISTSAIDISDGFYGDLSKIINSKLIGANIYSSKIPYSSNLKKLFAKNKIVTSDVLNAGDDYELIFTAPKDNRSKLKKIATKYHYRITKVGRIIGKNGIYVDDQKIMKFKNPYQHSF